MSTLFISDLHLEESRPAVTAAFLQFLQQDAIKADALYILGDLFEVWIGDDHHHPLHQSVIDALRHLTQSGVPVYLMHGNRDFLLGKRFARNTGCQFIVDPTLIHLYGQPVLLMHGDTLCTADKKYLQFRRYARNRLFQWFFLLKSLKKRKAIADKIRAASKQHTGVTAIEIMDVSQQEVERVMRQQGVKLLIHGHTHRPNVHYFPLDNAEVCRIVLRDWDNEGGFLSYGSDHQFRLETVKIPSL